MIFQAYLSELRSKKWSEMKERGGVLRERTLLAAETAKAHSKLHAEETGAAWSDNNNKTAEEAPSSSST